MSVYGPDGSLNVRSRLSGPGSTGYASDPHGYGDAREVDGGGVYVHTVYADAGVPADYHA